VRPAISVAAKCFFRGHADREIEGVRAARVVEAGDDVLPRDDGGSHVVAGDGCALGAEDVLEAVAVVVRATPVRPVDGREELAALERLENHRPRPRLPPFGRLPGPARFVVVMKPPHCIVLTGWLPYVSDARSRRI